MKGIKFGKITIVTSGSFRVFSILVRIAVVLDGDSDCVTIGIMVFVM